MATTKNTKRYIEAIGRRKTATARVRITPAKAISVTVNGKSLEAYFQSYALQQIVLGVFDATETIGTYEVSAKVYGGGMSAQATAVRLGIARALVEGDQELRTPLKKEGFLKRDPRSKERKKFGLRKARKSPQWSKR